MGNSQKGFTLIEVIATLILVGLLVAVAGIVYSRMIEGVFFARMTSTTLQKGQMAISRISLEIKNASTISGVSTATSINFNSYKDNVGKTRRIRIEGNHVELDDGDGVFHRLTDQVAAPGGFLLRYYARYNDTSECDPPDANIIAVTLRMAGAAGIIQELVERVTPRNM